MDVAISNDKVNGQWLMKLCCCSWFWCFASILWNNLRSNVFFLFQNVWSQVNNEQSRVYYQALSQKEKYTAWFHWTRSVVCGKSGISKRAKSEQDSGEEWVTTGSRKGYRKRPRDFLIECVHLNRSWEFKCLCKCVLVRFR